MGRCTAVRRLGLFAAAATAALALVGCQQSFTEGPTGRVVDKDRDWVRSGKHSGKWKYELTVRTKSGAETEFRVGKSTFDDCVRGSAYPKCARG